MAELPDSSRSAFLFVFALLFTGLAVAGCDQMTGSSPGDTGDLSETESAVLSYSHMPRGTSLPSPDEVPLKNGIVGAEGERTEGETLQPKNDSSGVESPYGCYLASRPYTDSTRIRSVYLYFSTDMVEAAEEKTRSFVWQMSAAWSGGEADARYAHCVVPAVSEAREVATEQLLRAGEKDDAWSLADVGSESASAKACIQIVYKIATTCVGGGGDFPEESCETEIESVTVCGGGGGGDGGTTDPWPDDDGGGGGGGGDDTGGGTDEDCEGVVIPEPGSDCEPPEPDVDETQVCSKDPLKDMDIRATCAGIGGGRFGEEAREDANGDPKPHWGLDLGGSDAEIGTEISALEGGTVNS